MRTADLAQPRADIARPCAAIVNVAEHLRETAQRVPDQHAIVWRAHNQYQHWTFRQLDEETDRYAHGLAAAGITRGMRTILMVRQGPKFFALTFALYRIGAVPVLVDPGMGRQRMVQCLAAINAEAFIGIPLAHILRIMHPAAFQSLRIVITAGRRIAWGGKSLSRLRRAATTEPFRAAQTSPDDPAAIIFTTGSTGPPKAVLYRHGMFDAQVRILREHFGIAPGEIDLPTFPLFALFDPALGMTAVIPEMDPTRPAHVDPRKIIRAINERRVTHMFGSPALLHRVGRFGEAHGVKIPTLRRVISAGAPVPPDVLRRFAAMLPAEARIHTPYGATEALPVASISHDEILGDTAAQTARGAGTCVGRPVAPATVRIIRITDDPIDEWNETLVLPTGQIGEIVVKGPVVTREYLTNGAESPSADHNGDAATRRAKIADGKEVWHRMGDVGYLDATGRFWFCGRKSHRVETPSSTMFTEPVEAIFNQHPAVFRSALVGIGPRPNQRPVICIELDPTYRHADRKQIIAGLLDLARQFEPTRPIDTFLFHPSFPVDIRHNAKIFREKLAAWAAGDLNS